MVFIYIVAFDSGVGYQTFGTAKDFVLKNFIRDIIGFIARVKASPDTNSVFNYIIHLL